MTHTIFTPFTSVDVQGAIAAFRSQRGHEPSFVVLDSETARGLRDDLSSPLYHDDRRLRRWLFGGCEMVVIPADVPFLKVVGDVGREIIR